MTKFPLLAILLTTALPVPAAALVFDTGDLVVSVEGKGDTNYLDPATGLPKVYTDNQAAPLSLFEYTTTGTKVGSMALPQTTAGTQYAVSGEYGSSSEGMLQLSGNGQYLTIMGYGVNANDFDANPVHYGTHLTGDTTTSALGQSTSIQQQGYEAVARVVAEISATGTVDSSTALYNVYNGNNPRSVFTVDGKTFYTSGQGTGSDSTGGVFFTSLGSNSATPITGNDTSGKTLSQDTRDVQVVNGTLTVSVDSKGGSNSARSFIGTLGTPPATSTYDNNNGPTQLTGFGTSSTGKYNVTTATGNSVNNAAAAAASGGSLQINLSPEGFFYANASTLYVADSGNGKQNSANSTLGDGGLQKWSLVGSTWKLDYTISAGLDLVDNPASNKTDLAGTTGLLSLTGKVLDNGMVELFATNYTIGDTDQTYLYGIEDLLTATTAPTGEGFTQLAAAPADSNFKGVSFAPTAAPVPEPASWAMMLAGFGLLGLNARRRQRGVIAAV